jgi:hypothetical protein
MGGGGMNLFGVNNSVVVSNTISLPNAASGVPITLGNLPGYAAAFNLVTKNTINWIPSTGSPAVNEDGTTYSACVGVGQSNTVNGNNLVPPQVFGGYMYEFQRCNGSNSGTGQLRLSTVTAGGTALTDMDLQTEGSAGYPYLNIYQNASGTGTRVGTLSVGGFQPVSMPFGNWSGTVNTNNYAVSSPSPVFSGISPGQTITITAVQYVIALVNSSTSLTLTSSAGSQTGASASVVGLPAATGYPGSIVYCTTCTSPSSPCSGSGSGAFAFSNGSAWKCF